MGFEKKKNQIQYLDLREIFYTMAKKKKKKKNLKN
jgi:hypothetical protein